MSHIPQDLHPPYRIGTVARGFTSADDIRTVWRNFTPATTNLTVNNGTLTGRYLKIDTLLHLSIVYTVGSTDTLTATSWQFGLPTGVTAAAFKHALAAVIVDVSSGVRYPVSAEVATSGSTAAIQVGSQDGAFFVSSTRPMTWATGDQLIVTGIIETA